MNIKIDQSAYDYNREIFNKAVKSNKIVVVKTPRQSGGTTFISEYCVDNYDTKIIVLTTKMACGREILTKCNKIAKTRGCIDNVKTVTSYENILKFNNLGYKTLIIDQCAFIKEETLNKINFSDFTKVIIVSTPTNSSGYFYEKFNNISLKGISLRSPYNLNDPETVDGLLELFGGDECKFKQEVLGMFYTKKDEIQTVTLNNVKIEKLLYMTVIERIRQIEEKTHNAYTLTISDYIRELIKADIKENILVDLFFSED